MSTRPAIIQLVQGPLGKLSAILYANTFLHQSLTAQIAARERGGYINKYPALAAVLLTHFLPINTSFKPCVICAFEYVRTTESICPGKRTEIEMKQNCDYINDMYLEYDTPEVSCTLAQLPDIVVKPKDTNTYVFNGSVSLNFATGALNTPDQEANSGNINVVDGFNYRYDTIAGAFIDTPITINGANYIIRVQTGGLNPVPNGGISYTYVDQNYHFIAGPDGTVSNPGVNGFGTGGQLARVQRANHVYGAELFGLKLYPHNCFKVDDNVISPYSSRAATNYRTRMLGPLTRPAFDRLIGQEVPRDVIEYNYSSEGSTGSGLPHGSAQTHHSRMYSRSADGLQTPKPVHRSTRIITPLLHWFNTQRRTSLPVTCMPDGKLVIEIEMEKLENMFFPAPSIFIEERLYAVNVADANGTLAVPNISATRRIPYLIPKSTVTANSSCECVSLVSCNILLDELIHNIIINRIGFNLITLFKEEISCAKDSNCTTVNINQLKWPTEYIHISDYLAENVDNRLPSAGRTWHRCGKITTEDTSEYDTLPTRRQNGAVNIFETHRFASKIRYTSHTQNIVQNLGVYIYDSPFFCKHNTREFYADYLPFTYSNGTINCDTDAHAPIFITFANMPGIYQPTGFVNLSKNKNMYLELTYGVDFDSRNKVFLHSVANARNFILIADGSCIVRFS